MHSRRSLRRHATTRQRGRVVAVLTLCLAAVSPVLGWSHASARSTGPAVAVSVHPNAVDVGGTVIVRIDCPGIAAAAPVKVWVDGPVTAGVDLIELTEQQANLFGYYASFYPPNTLPVSVEFKVLAVPATRGVAITVDCPDTLAGQQPDVVDPRIVFNGWVAVPRRTNVSWGAAFAGLVQDGNGVIQGAFHHHSSPVTTTTTTTATTSPATPPTRKKSPPVVTAPPIVVTTAPPVVTTTPPGGCPPGYHYDLNGMCVPN